MTERKHLTFFESVCGADRVFSEEPMSRHTTFRVGGPADYFLVPGDPDQLKKLVRYCKDNGIAFFILGNGSNLLVSDEGYRGAVIQLFRNMSEIRIEGTRIYADAGALLSQIAAQAAAASLTGLEFAGGIPGTLGGACVMNAGAYGGEMKDVLLTVTVLTPSGEVVTVPASSMELGYRTSCIPRLYRSGGRDGTFSRKCGGDPGEDGFAAGAETGEAAARPSQCGKHVQKAGRIFCGKTDHGRRTPRILGRRRTGLGKALRLCGEPGRCDC